MLKLKWGSTVGNVDGLSIFYESTMFYISKVLDSDILLTVSMWLANTCSHEEFTQALF